MKPLPLYHFKAQCQLKLVKMIYCTYLYYCMFNFVCRFHALNFNVLVGARPNASDDEVLALCCVSKQIMIHQLPPVLILHIKRFNIGSYRVTKDNTYVSFPPILNVASYCTTDCLEVNKWIKVNYNST